jgi:predicted transcriptional regulator
VTTEPSPSGGHHVPPDLALGELPELRAADVMTTDLLAVDASESLIMAWELMTRAGVHHVPIVREGRCQWVLDDRRLATEIVHEPLGHQRRAVGDLLTAPTLRVALDEPLRGVARELLASTNDAVLVHSEDGQTVGMITVHDVLRALTGEHGARRHEEYWQVSATLFRIVPVMPTAVPS